MQPQQPGHITANHNPYEFITNPVTAPKKSLFSGGSGPKKILLIVGGATVVLLLLVAVASMLGGGSAKKEDYTTMLQQQAEIIRVTDLGTKSAKNNEAKNLAITTRQTMESQTAAITAVAVAAGVKADKKVIAGGINKKTDAQLTSAEQLNKFDEQFITTLKSQLTDYQKTLKKLYDTSKSQKSKDTLSKNYDYIQLLLGAGTQDAKSGSSESTPATN